MGAGKANGNKIAPIPNARRITSKMQQRRTTPIPAMKAAQDKQCHEEAFADTTGICALS